MKVASIVLSAFLTMFIISISCSRKSPDHTPDSQLQTVVPATGDQAAAAAAEDPENETNPLNSDSEPTINSPQGAPADLTSDFSAKLKPIFEAKCTRCHNADGIAAVAAFKTSTDIAKFGGAIQYKIQNKSMPPWFLKNDGSCGTYQHDPTVTITELAAIKAWLSSKTTAGVPAPAEADIALSPPAQLGLSTADPNVLTLQMASPYTPTPSPGTVDEYRCFVLNSATTADKIMTSYQVIPGRKELVHHLILYTINNPTDEATVVNLDNQDPKPGYSCFGGPGVATAAPAIIWAPGQGVEQLPSGTGMPLTANRKSVIQIHYNTASLAGVSDQTKILMKTTSGPGTAPGQWLFVGSASGAAIPKGMATVDRSFSLNVPTDGSMFGFFPHMHKYGKSVKLENASQCLGLAERWDFAWQLNYFLTAPVQLKAGNTLTATCNYDTSRAPADVNFGENSEDEMCFGFVYFVDKNQLAAATANAVPWSAKLLDATVPEKLKFSVTTDSSNINRLGALFISALYQGKWYFWDPNLQPAQRWVAIADPTTATTLPEAVATTAPATFEFTATEINSTVHGAQIFVGVGYGANPSDRKIDLLNFQRYTQIYLVP
jgi:hypothetical protein